MSVLHLVTLKSLVTILVIKIKVAESLLIRETRSLFNM